MLATTNLLSHPDSLKSPGFLSNIPPPLSMRWQLTVPSDESDAVQDDEFENESSDDIATIFEPQWFHEMDTFHNKPSTNIEIKENMKDKPLIPLISLISGQCDKNIQTILDQYGECNNYDQSSSIVINGYIRDIQKRIKSVIPTDINNLCLAFYYEIENKYIHLSYKLYQIFYNNNNDKTDEIHTVSGNQLIAMIQTNELHQIHDDENINQICNNLMKYKFIELVSYQTNFFSLFDKSPNNDKNSSFTASNNYVYKLSNDSKRTFEEYTKFILNSQMK